MTPRGTVRVWRVEHREERVILVPKARRGPYAGQHDLQVAHNNDSHPSPCDDIGATPDWRYLYGCASRSQLRNWFRGWLPTLRGRGYIVATYDVPSEDVLYGKRQVAFIPDNSRRIVQPW